METFLLHRAEWRRRGERNSSCRARAKREFPAEPLTAEEMHSYLSKVFIDVIEGRKERGIETTAASIAQALVDVAEAVLASAQERIVSAKLRLQAVREAQQTALNATHCTHYQRNSLQQDITSRRRHIQNLVAAAARDAGTTIFECR